MIIARNVRRLRAERGLTQEALAAKAGISTNYVGKIEREENSPSSDVIEKLARVLGVEPWTILKP